MEPTKIVVLGTGGTIAGKAAALASGPLLKAFFRFPLLTLGVVARIHWQALKLWLKKAPFHTHPEKLAETGSGRSR